ncbi:MAG: NTP transferase domain-containing protein [Bacteroidetes bacterium]|nr:NTP transferase domain-containing protein [Bacteroidota bacterium]
MNIIIPMAGMGKRMRPHTLTVPKPLISIAGKPIVAHLVDELSKVYNDKIDEIAFIVGDFSQDVIDELKNIAISYKAEPKIYHQTEPLGTAHAVYCAAQSLKGNVIVAFADTLFKANFKIDENVDGTIWVNKVDNPSSFGVVKIDESNFICDFIEKPKEFVSDLAIIGIYYFKQGEILKNELAKLIKDEFKVNGEYQLTDALKRMQLNGIKFNTGSVDEWLDCGNKDATVYTNQRLLHLLDKNQLVSKNAQIINSKIIDPCYIDEKVKIKNSVIGPYTTIHKGTEIKNSIVRNSVIQKDTLIENQNIENSMIGNNVKIISKADDLSIGDFSNIVK